MTKATEFFSDLRAQPSAAIAKPEELILPPMPGISLTHIKSTMFIVFILAIPIVSTSHLPGEWILIAPFAFVALRYALPLIFWFARCLSSGQLRADTFIRSFSPLRAKFYLFMAWGLSLELLDTLLGGPFKYSSRYFFDLIGVPGLVFLLPAIPVALAIYSYEWLAKRAAQTPVLVQNVAPKTVNNEFALYVGKSTGWLASLRHGSALAAGQNVTVTLQDAAQNVCILGGIGSGKTTRGVQPLLLQLMDQDAGGLIFDVKGDFTSSAQSLAAEAGRQADVIGPGRTRMNLLDGLTPEVAASFLKSALLMAGRSHSDPFWIDTGSELCRTALGALSFLPGEYSLATLYQFIFNPIEHDRLSERAKQRLESLPDEKQRKLLLSYLSYQGTIFEAFDEKVKSGVRATVSQILSPFQHPELSDAFCESSNEAPNMDEVLNGKVFVVDLPLAKWGLGAKVAYAFIKLRFFNAVQRRNIEPELNKERPVFFVCDEYQEIVSCNKDGLSDLNFWDKSRSSRCIGIVSAQGISSFYAAIGDRDLANALIQNFRQKLIFRTEDSETLRYANYLMGSIEMPKISHSQSVSFSGSNNPNQNSGQSVAMTQQEVINPQMMRQLSGDQCLALLSIGGAARDDVLLCSAMFVK